MEDILIDEQRKGEFVYQLCKLGEELQVEIYHSNPDYDDDWTRVYKCSPTEFFSVAIAFEDSLWRWNNGAGPVRQVIEQQPKEVIDITALLGSGNFKSLDRAGHSGDISDQLDYIKSLVDKEKNV